METIKQVIYGSQNPDQVILDQLYEDFNVVFITENQDVVATYNWNEQLQKHIKE